MVPCVDVWMFIDKERASRIPDCMLGDERLSEPQPLWDSPVPHTEWREMKKKELSEYQPPHTSNHAAI